MYIDKWKRNREKKETKGRKKREKETEREIKDRKR